MEGSAKSGLQLPMAISKSPLPTRSRKLALAMFSRRTWMPTSARLDCVASAIGLHEGSLSDSKKPSRILRRPALASSSLALAGAKAAGAACASCPHMPSGMGPFMALAWPEKMPSMMARTSTAEMMARGTSGLSSGPFLLWGGGRFCGILRAPLLRWRGGRRGLGHELDDHFVEGRRRSIRMRAFVHHDALALLPTAQLEGAAAHGVP